MKLLRLLSFIKICLKLVLIFIVEGSDVEIFDCCNGYFDNLGVYYYYQFFGLDNCGDIFIVEVDQFIGEYKCNLWVDLGGGGLVG